MGLLQEQKQQIINEYQLHATDTGSPEVQIALLSARINQLSEHLRTHKKDYASQRGLLKLISQRRQLLLYLRKHHYDRYESLVQRLGIRGLRV
ncbi:MAG: 30S ribosomal protein S15 [Gloeomargarita sp. SKYBB_i_bin120]|nr:30S ribosomal protein S15 [Gloeomargarita sp. SKYG98]MCS7292173.1 30S ribosomal protein S15 [Gloeomargarita sp. SKYB120]MDW8177734.1 30S ribosomal protein S15 [Gloeomargarita sp. SKYBB_i_bin120]